MLNDDDKKEIRKIVRSEVEIRTDPLRGALVSIESKVDVLKDIVSLIKGQGEQIKDHEERITSLESRSN